MKNYLKLLISGFFTSLIFPPFFLIPVGLISIPYFYNKINEIKKNQSPTQIFLEGFFFGLGLNLFLFFWLKNPFFIEEETKKLSFLFLIFIFYASIYFGILTLTLKLFHNKIKIIVFPLLFVLFEIIRSKLFLGFPWNLFAYSFSNINFFASIVKIFGTYTLSYVVMVILLYPIILVNLWKKKDFNFNLFYLILSLIFILLILVFSNYYKNDKNLFNKKEYNLDVVVYQSNIPQAEKWNLSKMDNRFEELMEFINLNSKNNKPTIIIFSETEIPYIISKNSILLELIQSQLDQNTTIVIGAVRKQNKNYYNTMYRINSQDISFFDKKILVPFGEYIPLRKFLPFINKFTVGIEDFKKGNNVRKLKLFDDLFFIPSICYENIFFDKLINKNNEGIPLLINITNDAWFGKYQGPNQHFYHSILRSLEYNKYLIRVSNNGISAIVDNNGKILISTKLNQKSTFKYNLKINKNNYFLKNKYLIFYLYLTLSLSLCLVLNFYKKYGK